ncbi:MAG: signal peptidase I [Phycisphaerales bacterium JB039]
MPSSPEQNPTQRRQTSIKETLTSITIAFVMAFVFRAFVIEAFVIPTGSMAPTLMGAHMRFRAPQTATTWQVGPWDESQRGASRTPDPVQTEIEVHDPNLVGFPDPSIDRRRVLASQVRAATKPLLSGDRILVFKYLPPLLSPQRFDIVVFKYPGGPQEAYIKRLIGLPGEQIALVDGDVFVRKLAPRAGPDGKEIWAPAPEELALPGGTWDLTGWEIARKPERVQREVWQPVYDADYAPRFATGQDGARWFEGPWEPSGAGWTGLDGRSYHYAGAGAAILRWNSAEWPIDDWYPYNETTGDFRALGRMLRFPVGDVRIRFGYEPQADGLTLTTALTTRRHQFRALVEPEQVTLQMRPQPHPEATDPAWETLETVRLGRPLKTDHIYEVEFWHADQALSLFIDGRRIAYKPYYWNPAQRIEQATGMGVDQILQREEAGLDSRLRIPSAYDTPAEPEIRLSGPAALHRVAVDRDIYYQPGSGNRPDPLRAAHPRNRLVILNQDQFFTCGDNSPASSDGRMWEEVDPWVAQVDPTPGVVPRDLLVGRAFFVYFPSLHKEGGPLVAPDFGRLRFLY